MLVSRENDQENGKNSKRETDRGENLLDPDLLRRDPEEEVLQELHP